MEFGRAGRFLDEPAYYCDLIDESVRPKRYNHAKIAELYLGKALSAAQIAVELGIAKSSVLEILQGLTIREPKGSRMTNPLNYRASVVPYGMRVVRGKLIENKSEMKICRIVVKIVGEEKLSLCAAARKLMDKNIKNRSGNVWWDHSMVDSIFKRWNGKIN